MEVKAGGDRGQGRGAMKDEARGNRGRGQWLRKAELASTERES